MSRARRFQQPDLRRIQSSRLLWRRELLHTRCSGRMSVSTTSWIEVLTRVAFTRSLERSRPNLVTARHIHFPFRGQRASWRWDPTLTIGASAGASRRTGYLSSTQSCGEAARDASASFLHATILGSQPLFSRGPEGSREDYRDDTAVRCGRQSPCGLQP